MKLQIVPYKQASASARSLAKLLTQRLGYKVVRGEPDPDKVNLLWGYRYEAPNAPQRAEAINVSRNKVKTFVKLKEAGVNVPDFTNDKNVATEWVAQGKTVLARTATGQGGSGITVVTSLPVVDAPLYVKYVKKRKEFRVHVFNGQAIEVQEKRKRQGVEANPLIRSHNNGWVFCHFNILEPANLRDTAVAAVSSLGLLFGAADIIWNEQQNKLYLLEVNTAPGLEGTTLERYADAIQAFLG